MNFALNQMFVRKKFWIGAVLVLVAWSWFKLRWESFLFQEARRLGGVSLSLNVSERVGQGAMIAVLSGFRTVLADWLWLKVNEQFEQREWKQLRETAELVCLLQPRSPFFWEMSAWHLAWNVSHAVRYEVQEPSLSRRIKAQNDYIKAGRAVLDRGLKYIPDRYELWAARGFLRSEKQKDYIGAAEDFLKATTFPEAPVYVFRQVAHNLELAKKWPEAYAFWCEIWQKFPDKSQTPEMRWDRVKVRIQRLEERLAIPEAQRLFQ